MAETMHRGLMSFRNHHRGHLRVALHLGAEHEERRSPAQARQRVEHREGAVWMGSVVEGQRDMAWSADPGQPRAEGGPQHPAS